MSQPGCVSDEWIQPSIAETVLLLTLSCVFYVYLRLPIFGYRYLYSKRSVEYIASTRKRENQWIWTLQ